MPMQHVEAEDVAVAMHLVDEAHVQVAARARQVLFPERQPAQWRGHHPHGKRHEACKEPCDIQQHATQSQLAAPAIDHDGEQRERDDKPADGDMKHHCHGDQNAAEKRPHVAASARRRGIGAHGKQ